uniref:Myb-like DNA-binding domain-containing protein n=1 Tax=Trepomonas sp. PC1 TaxID=1076344 RepID=A0A146KIX2_9EUKA|eukprot:JAP95545.1 Hypothetical protein TPC1_11433 [Trepomonas sp. PC1]
MDDSYYLPSISFISDNITSLDCTNVSNSPEIQEKERSTELDSQTTESKDHNNPLIFFQQQQKMLQDQIASMQKSQMQHNRAQEFKWEPQIHIKFVQIVMAFGVRNVTPKQIQMVLEANTSRESIGSHLQKFRMKLVKQYGVQSYLQLSNRHFPQDLNDPKLKQLQLLWAAPSFSGMSIRAAKQFVYNK